MSRVSGSHNRHMPYHFDSSDLEVHHRNDCTSYNQTDTSDWTVRRPDALSSHSPSTTPLASRHARRRTSRGTPYSPLRRTTSDSYSTDSASPPSSNTAPHRIRAHNPHSGTRTYCRFHEILPWPSAHSDPTTSHPLDEKPWSVGSRSHIPRKSRVFLGYNTHTIRHFQCGLMVIPFHAHTPYSQTNTSYCCSETPPQAPSDSSGSTPTHVHVPQRTEGDRLRRSWSHRAISKQESTPCQDSTLLFDCSRGKPHRQF